MIQTPPRWRPLRLLPHQHGIKSNLSLRQTSQAQIGHRHKVRKLTTSPTLIIPSEEDCVGDRSVAFVSMCVCYSRASNSAQLTALSAESLLAHTLWATLCWQWRGNESKQEMMSCGQSWWKKKKKWKWHETDLSTLGLLIYTDWGRVPLHLVCYEHQESDFQRNMKYKWGMEWRRKPTVPLQCWKGEFKRNAERGALVSTFSCNVGCDRWCRGVFEQAM